MWTVLVAGHIGVNGNLNRYSRTVSIEYSRKYTVAAGILPF